MIRDPLAHSARDEVSEPQTYKAHIAGGPDAEGVRDGAVRRAVAMTRHLRDTVVAEVIVAAVTDAATFHDLGKLDPLTQQELGAGRGTRLTWDHVDAGVAHLRTSGARMAAWLVRAHHAPGLPSLPAHFPHRSVGGTGDYRRLRGVRRDNDIAPEKHRAQIERTDSTLSVILETHDAVIGRHVPASGKALHGLSMRLALSCLVDADHSNTANFDNGWTEPDIPDPRWPERLAALDRYVDGLGDRRGQRDGLRRAFYDACRHDAPAAAITACEGPVGIGKTTAVTAYLLGRAIATGARRLFIVAPYTAILSQTAERLREALVLPDEQDRADTVVAEHHHRADFDHPSARDLATLWTAPVILTTAVQFFETLASNEPSSLRKLHALPGSVVFLDEAHAALPTHLWPQNWRWLLKLADDWSCSFVLASGSLARFWEIEDIVGDARRELPDLVPADLVAPLRETEAARIHYVTEGRFDGPAALANAVQGAYGPRLLIMNTVQSAAAMARLLKGNGCDVLHLSTALCPRDRDAILQTVRTRLMPKSAYPADWTLVATSLMEAGIDVSFRTLFRERFATTSLIQIGGRGNRNFEWSQGVFVHDFIASHVDGLKRHPAATIPAEVLAELFEMGRFDRSIDAAGLVTLAMRQEIRRRGVSRSDLVTAESEHRYPDVAELGRVIDTDTRLVVVDRLLRDRIFSRERIATREILAGSVQIWSNKIDSLGLDTISDRKEIYWWPHAYDATFLGYMEGALRLETIAHGSTLIV